MSQISDRLIAFNKPLLPEMVQHKYQGMAENAFRYFRGTCHLFYEDLAGITDFPISPPVWICGDLHLENYGSFRADNKLVYFDLNDFDEAILAPALWEVVRLVTSIYVGFSSLDIEEEKAHNMVRLFLKTYADKLAGGKASNIEPRTAKGIVRDFLKSAAESKDSAVVHKRTARHKKKIVLSLSDERHFKIEKSLRLKLMDHIQNWINNGNDSPYNYKVKGAVFRLAGTGSIGVKRYLFLLRSTITKDKYLFVDMKQSRPSSLAPHVKVQQPSWNTDADRITEIQHRMQDRSAALLSTSVFKGEPFVLQELQPVKDSIKFKLLRDRYRDMYQVIDDMAVLTASSQLRSGGMDGSAIIDKLKAFGKKDDWQEKVASYAFSYAAKTRNDYRQYLRDYKRGLFKDKTLTGDKIGG
jgi:uncharacterized protein (DUF2252 family)